ncbi:MAG: SPFH domain-containing protein [Sphingomonadales bacterium]
MGLWDKIAGEFIDIIEWTDDSEDTLVWRFPRYGNEIKNGAKLTVRPTQAAIFVNEGQVADVFYEGMHSLTTQNLPILSTLKGWKYGFESPFKAEVYFVSLRTFTDNKWGTRNPIMLRDAEFGPVRLRAFGNFSFSVNDLQALITEIVGTDGHFTLEEIDSQLRTLMVTRFSDAIGESGIPVLDMASNYDELSALLKDKIQADFTQYGLELKQLLVENISLPPAVEEALDKRSSMGILGNLNQYTQYQAANALEIAADNPGGDASAGVGIGMGFAMANQLSKNLMGQQNTQQSPTQDPPPLPSQLNFYAALDGKQAGPFSEDGLKGLIQNGKITRDTLMWSQGMENWAKAADVDALKPLFSAVPPALPPGV